MLAGDGLRPLRLDRFKIPTLARPGRSTHYQFEIHLVPDGGPGIQVLDAEEQVRVKIFLNLLKLYEPSGGPRVGRRGAGPEPVLVRGVEHDPENRFRGVRGAAGGKSLFGLISRR